MCIQTCQKGDYSCLRILLCGWGSDDIHISIIFGVNHLATKLILKCQDMGNGISILYGNLIKCVIISTSHWILRAIIVEKITDSLKVE